MLPVKIISKEKAVKLGLACNVNNDCGGGASVAGVIVKAEPGKPEKLMEKQIITKDKREIVFIDDERINDLKKDKAKAKEYFKQFDKIVGNKESFLKKHNLGELE